MHLLHTLSVWYAGCTALHRDRTWPRWWRQHRGVLGLCSQTLFMNVCMLSTYKRTTQNTQDAVCLSPCHLEKDTALSKLIEWRTASSPFMGESGVAARPKDRMMWPYHLFFASWQWKAGLRVGWWLGWSFAGLPHLWYVGCRKFPRVFCSISFPCSVSSSAALL